MALNIQGTLKFLTDIFKEHSDWAGSADGKLFPRLQSVLLLILWRGTIQAGDSSIIWPWLFYYERWKQQIPHNRRNAVLVYGCTIIIYASLKVE